MARWAPSRLSPKAQDKLETASVALRERKGTAGSLVFASAVLGLPPFYAISLASGALGMGLRRFLAAGLAGRGLRFGVLAWAGHRWGSGAVEALVELGVPSILVGGGG